MEIMEMEWKKYVDEGHKYMKTAVNGLLNRKKVFTPEIIYNIVGMAIEKNIMGFLMYNKCMPDNHTLTDLANAVKNIDPVENELFEKMAEMDRFQEICSIDDYKVKVPDDNEISEFVRIGQEVQAFVDSKLSCAG